MNIDKCMYVCVSGHWYENHARIVRWWGSNLIHSIPQTQDMCMLPINFQAAQRRSKNASNNTTKKITDNGHIYQPPVWNLGSYVLWKWFKTNDEVRLTMTRNAPIRITTDNDDGQTRGIRKYAVISNTMPLWLVQGSCPTNKQDTRRIDHYPVAWEFAPTRGTNTYIYPFRSYCM